MLRSLAGLLGLAFFTFLIAQNAQANWQLLPKNSHELYETYGLFVDEQSIIVNYEASRAYGSLGGTFAFYGDPDSPGHPQFIIIASVNAAMRFLESGRIYSDELDVHAGGAFEWALNEAMRLSIGFIHYSGHVADGATDQDLLGENFNLGDNLAFVRYVFDLGSYVRVGATFIPVLHGGPPANFFGANQFLEIFPFGGADDSQKPSPYIAFGLQEGGTDQFNETTTFHTQIGAYLGNHFSNEFKPTLRMVGGYYTGADPRLKYWQFKGKTDTFYYIGLMVDY